MQVNSEFKKKRIIAQITTLLLSLLFLLIRPLSSFADDSLTIRRTSVNLTSGRITDQLILDMYLNQPEEVYISVSSPLHGGGNDRNFFYMKPISGNGKNHQVKLALDIPYEQLTPGGAYQINSLNTVVNQKNPPRLATNSYSSCRESINSYAGSRVCKPLSFLVVDMESVPGVIYGADLDIEITTKDHRTVLRDTVYVTYTNTSSPIGIYSARDRLSLKPNNSFKDSSLFCVFSQAEDHFDVRLEGERQNGELILRGEDNHYLPYSTSIYLNHHNQPENVKPFEWARGAEQLRPEISPAVWGRTTLRFRCRSPLRTSEKVNQGNIPGF